MVELVDATVLRDGFPASVSQGLVCAPELLSTCCTLKVTKDEFRHRDIFPTGEMVGSPFPLRQCPVWPERSKRENLEGECSFQRGDCDFASAGRLRVVS